jgi:predicted ATPase/class 3 adenylate cyclase
MTAMESGAALTFFFSDIEGSTRAAAALGDRFAAALEGHRRAVRSALAAAGGIEVSTAGDSFFAVFSSAAAAVTAAAAIQREPDAPEDVVPLRARIGLHSGQALRIGDDYVGIDVHRAARIADAGHGGQILVSATTRDALLDRLPASLSLVDLGRHRLKDVGPERLWQLAGDGLPAGPFPNLRSLEAHPTNLPPETTPFLGRAREFEELRALVMAERLVTVTGPGGIGKTRLAVAVARSLVAELADGVFHLDLASTTDTASAVSALVEVLGLRIEPNEQPLDALLDRLRSRDLLVVLDTADRVEGLGALAAAVASACPRVHVMVTSRSPLHVRAERDYPLGPLAADAGIELYASRAMAVRLGFQLDDATRPEVARLVARLDGLPLAIELAAARARLLTPTALLDRLGRRLPALGESSRDAPDRQRTLQATIAWSCELLTPDEQAVFEQLGVLEGTFDLTAIEAIALVPGRADVPSIVEALADRSLLRPEEASDGEPRFRLLGPMREFALDALRSRSAESDALERHAVYWGDLVRETASKLDRDIGMEAVERIGNAEPNVRAALEWLLAHQPPVAVELIASLGRYWRLRGRTAEGLSWLARARDADGDVSWQARADVLFWMGALQDDAARPEEAMASMEAALELRRAHGDEFGIARAMNSLGAIARSLGDLERSERLLEESIERSQALGDRRGVAMSLSNLGIVATDRGRHDVAAAYLARAQAIDEELGGADVIVGSTNLATTLIRAGRIDEGLARLQGALPGIARLDDAELVEQALSALAVASLDRGVEATMAARLALAADALAAAQSGQLLAPDRGALDELIARASAPVTSEELAAIRSEVRAVDVDAGLALARNALEILARSAA